MSLIKNVRNGNVHFIKDFKSGYKKINDSATLLQQSELEIAELKNMIEYMVEECPPYSAKGMTEEQIHGYLKKHEWLKIISNAIKGFDPKSKLHASFVALKEDFDELAQMRIKKSIDMKAYKELFIKIHDKGEEIYRLLTEAEKYLEVLVKYELGLLEKIKDVQRVV